MHYPYKRANLKYMTIYSIPVSALETLNAVLDGRDGSGAIWLEDSSLVMMSTVTRLFGI